MYEFTESPRQDPTEPNEASRFAHRQSDCHVLEGSQALRAAVGGGNICEDRRRETRVESVTYAEREPRRASHPERVCCRGVRRVRVRIEGEVGEARAHHVLLERLPPHHLAHNASDT